MAKRPERRRPILWTVCESITYRLILQEKY